VCEPVSITAGILAVVGAATAVYTANKAQKSLNEAAQTQQDQIDQSASAQTDDRLKQAREQRASARAASAESGASGNSTDAILNDLMMQSGRDVSRIEKNRENGILESAQEVRSKTSEINGQLVSGIASSAQSGGNAYSNYKIKTGH
jgi:gas vesicle protein